MGALLSIFPVGFGTSVLGSFGATCDLPLICTLGGATSSVDAFAGSFAGSSAGNVTTSLGIAATGATSRVAIAWTFSSVLATSAFTTSTEGLASLFSGSGDFTFSPTFCGKGDLPGGVPTAMKFDLTLFLNGVSLLSTLSSCELSVLAFCCSKNARSEETYQNTLAYP